MATYPTGVYAPASKSAGQTIQASFFNDPEAEITAVEDALKNGIQHPVSIAGVLTVSTGGMTVSTGSVNIGGPSSLATLQVNGGSTLATLAVTSTASFASSVTFAGNITVTGTVNAGGYNAFDVPRVRVSHSTTQALTQSAWVGLAWDTETFDSTGMHSTASNSSRLLFANSTGVFLIGANLFVNVSGDPTIVAARFLLNATTEIARQDIGEGGSTTRGLSLTTTWPIASTADVLTVEVLHDSASTCSVSSQSAFWAHRVSS